MGQVWQQLTVCVAIENCRSGWGVFLASHLLATIIMHRLAKLFLASHRLATLLMHRLAKLTIHRQGRQEEQEQDQEHPQACL